MDALTCVDDLRDPAVPDHRDDGVFLFPAHGDDTLSGEPVDRLLTRDFATGSP
jgi:hypothetical protein